MSFQIAIDGPVAAGKTTVAKLVAEKLKFVYIDTGAMYRAVAFAAQQRHIDWNNELAISELVTKLTIDLKKPVGKKKDGRPVSVFLNGKDVSWDIRNQEIGEGASVVSQYQKVRSVLVARQQFFADDHNITMEGRDIGTRVLPKAPLKIFLTADVETRVKREVELLKTWGKPKPIEEVRAALIKRDERELNRDIDPLRPAPDAWILDSTNLTIPEVVTLIVTLAKLRFSNPSIPSNP